jgi:hypothetical protein
MTRSERLEWWRNLAFWQRLLIECSIWVGVSLLIDVIGRRSFDFEWVISGLALGVFLAIVDHASFARRPRRQP